MILLVAFSYQFINLIKDSFERLRQNNDHEIESLLIIFIRPQSLQTKDLITKKIIKINNGAQFNWWVIPNQSASQFSFPKLFKKTSNSLSF
jgi:hypothetical protein